MSEAQEGTDGVSASPERLWFRRLRQTTGEWGKWSEVDAATVEDFRANVTLPIYEVRQFVPVSDVEAGPAVPALDAMFAKSIKERDAAPGVEPGK